jgi:hypothetical protein
MTIRIVHVWRIAHAIVSPFSHVFIEDEGRRFYSLYHGHIDQRYVEHDFRRSNLDPLTRRYL